MIETIGCQFDIQITLDTHALKPQLSGSEVLHDLRCPAPNGKDFHFSKHALVHTSPHVACSTKDLHTLVRHKLDTVDCLVLQDTDCRHGRRAATLNLRNDAFRKSCRGFYGREPDRQQTEPAARHPGVQPNTTAATLLLHVHQLVPNDLRAGGSLQRQCPPGKSSSLTPTPT